MNIPNEAVQYRLERAEEAYHDALTLAESGGWNSCVNRLYWTLDKIEAKKRSVLSKKG